MNSAAPARPVALVADAGFYVGPPLARLLATRGFDLALGDPSIGLADEVSELGAAVVALEGCRDLAAPGSAQRLVDAALERFGRLDSAVAFSGRIVTGRFMRSSVEDFRTVMEGCMVAPYEFMKAVLPPMIEAQQGQVLVITSASAARPTPGAPLYSAARAGAIGGFGQRQAVGVVLQPQRPAQQRLQVLKQRLAVERGGVGVAHPPRHRREAARDAHADGQPRGTQAGLGLPHQRPDGL